MAALAIILGTLGAASIGGVVGAWLTHRLQSPSPVVLVSSVSLSNDVLGSGDPANPDWELVHDCENNPFVGDRLPRGLRLSRSLYGAYLRQSLDKIEDALTARLPAVQHGADELQRHLAADDFARSEAVLATSWPDFWPVLEGSYLRQEFDFSAPEKDRSSSARHHEVSEDGDGNPVVIRGGHVLNITLSVREGPLRARSRAFAERVADTVSYRDKDDLLDVTNFLVHIAGQLGAYRDVRERLQDEVQRNSYVLLRGHVANGERSPFSVLDRGRMFLALAGFQPTGQEGAGAIEGDLELEMAIATADLQPGPPRTWPPYRLSRS